jgi:hypothetical protein
VCRLKYTPPEVRLVITVADRVHVKLENDPVGRVHTAAPSAPGAAMIDTTRHEEDEGDKA